MATRLTRVTQSTQILRNKITKTLDNIITILKFCVAWVFVVYSVEDPLSLIYMCVGCTQTPQKTRRKILLKKIFVTCASAHAFSKGPTFDAPQLRPNCKIDHFYHNPGYPASTSRPNFQNPHPAYFSRPPQSDIRNIRIPRPTSRNLFPTFPTFKLRKSFPDFRNPSSLEILSRPSSLRFLPSSLDFLNLHRTPAIFSRLLEILSRPINPPPVKRELLPHRRSSFAVTSTTQCHTSRSCTPRRTLGPHGSPLQTILLRQCASGRIAPKLHTIHNPVKPFLRKMFSVVEPQKRIQFVVLQVLTSAILQHDHFPLLLWPHRPCVVL